MRRLAALLAIELLLVAGRASAQEVFASTNANVSGNGAAQWQGWNPAALPSPVMRLEPNTGITIATGISAWTDAGGSGMGLSQASTGAQPTYTATSPSGVRVATFDGSAAFLSLASAITSATGSWTIAAVVHPTSVTSTRCIFTIGTSTTHGASLLESSGTRELYYGGVAVLSDSTASSNVWEVLIATHVSGASTLMVNGTVVSLSSATSSPGSADAVTAMGAGSTGGAQYWSGAIGTVDVWSRALSVGEQSQLTTYERALFGF